MKPLILDGRKLAGKIEKQLIKRVYVLKTAGVKPCLGIVLLEGDQASEIFVRNKIKKAEELGVEVIAKPFPRKSFLEGAQELINKWNKDERVHGIVVQLPRGRVRDLGGVIRNVFPEKDVDCLHPENIGLLSLGVPRFVPPTPAGIHRLLVDNKIKVAGKKIVIVGRSNLVGKPLAITLLQKDKNANATVTVCHSQTVDLINQTKKAEILVVAIGQPEFVTKSYVGKGAVVVDVGVHKIEGKWVGDVKHSEVDKITQAVTPVPGGVGPMTVIMLLQNLIEAAERRKL